MRKEEAAAHIEVIKALADGKVIQARCGSPQWVDVDNPEFFVGSEYRVKPEPRTFYMVRSVSQSSNNLCCATCHNSLDEAYIRVRYITSTFGLYVSDLEVIKVMEIVE